MKNHHLIVTLLILLFLSACAPPTAVQTAIPTEASSALPDPTTTVLPTATDPPPTPELTPTNLTPTDTLPPTPTAESSSPPAIILFIGDGMGAVHRKAATWLVSGEGGLLMMDNMPVHGLASTASANDLTTDSAAAATAMATGFLTNNRYLGVDPQQSTLTTILELAQVSGWSVGLVTTVQLAHATPAAFASHYPDRNNYTEIARQMMAHQVDVLLGGGEDDFYSTEKRGCYPGNGRQNRDSDLVEQAVEWGYTYVCTAEELQALDLSQTEHLLGLFGSAQILPPFSPTLAQMTQAAISVLSQDPDGFFLMVEAGQIDWAAHENDAEATMQNTVGLDSAVVTAQVYALRSPNTLIIVTADHETGGMRLNRDGEGSYLQDGPFQMPDGSNFWVDWTITGHMPDPVPVTAQGPYSEMLSGEYPLTRIFEAMSAMLFISMQ